MKNYYAILGVEPYATLAAIKAAYRQLALEAHPDRLSHLPEEQQAQAAGRMTDLNEAYRALSDAARRREYDESLRAPSGGAGKAAAAAAPSASDPPPAPPPPAPPPKAASAPRGRMRPGEEFASSVIGQFSQRIKQSLFSSSAPLFRVHQLEGFDWAGRSGKWPRYVVAAFRGFPTLDAEQSRKFLAAVEQAVNGSKRLVGSDVFIFILAFQRASTANILHALRDKFGRATNNRAALVIADAVRGRSMVAGRKADKLIEAALKKAGIG